MIIFQRMIKEEDVAITRFLFNDDTGEKKARAKQVQRAKVSRNVKKDTRSYY